MVIGVKYCGGCNSVYNRSRQVELLKQQFGEHEYRTAAQGNVCDLWLVVCGCLRACASSEGLTAKKRLFVLATERSFSEVKNYLAAEQTVAKLQQTEEAADAAAPEPAERKKLYVGQEAELKKSFFKDDAVKFAALTGDYSRLHTDAEFAKTSVFGRPVIHGVLAASLISSVMGMQLPGEGTILVEEQVRFLKPVFYGDTLTARVRFLSCREGKKQYIGAFCGVCTNQNGETVAAARCRQLMTKELFEVINPEDTVSEIDDLPAPQAEAKTAGQEF